MKFVPAAAILGIAAALAGCSSTPAEVRDYKSLSTKVDAIVQRTQGDPAKMSAEDQQILADARKQGLQVPNFGS